MKFRKEVEIAIELDPRNLDALDSMMQFKYQAPGLMGGSKDEARALADKITALNASEGYLAHAELAELEKNPAQMEAYFLKAVQANPKNYEAQTALAKFYSQSPHAKYDEAAKHAQSALQFDPTRIGGYWILARVFALQQRWSDLEQFLASAQKSFPMICGHFMRLRRDYWKLAKTCPERKVTQENTFRRNRRVMSRTRPMPTGYWGWCLRRRVGSAEARAELQTALQLRPNFKAAKED